MVFDGVISPTLELLGKVSPLVAHIFVKEEKDPLFVVAPLLLVNVWVKVVVPSLSALLADSS